MRLRVARRLLLVAEMGAVVAVARRSAVAAASVRGLRRLCGVVSSIPCRRCVDSRQEEARV
jgi:hypothetical protein